MLTSTKRKEKKEHFLFEPFRSTLFYCKRRRLAEMSLDEKEEVVSGVAARIVEGRPLTADKEEDDELLAEEEEEQQADRTKDEVDLSAYLNDKPLPHLEDPLAYLRPASEQDPLVPPPLPPLQRQARDLKMLLLRRREKIKLSRSGVSMDRGTRVLVELAVLMAVAGIVEIVLGSVYLNRTSCQTFGVSFSAWLMGSGLASFILASFLFSSLPWVFSLPVWGFALIWSVLAVPILIEAPVQCNHDFLLPIVSVACAIDFFFVWVFAFLAVTLRQDMKRE